MRRGRVDRLLSQFLEEDFEMSAPLLGSIRRWYRNWRAARKGAVELQCAGAAEVERIAQELGFSSSELRSLVSHPDEHQLLAQRMARLRLQSSVFAEPDPATSRDLQRVCAMCGFKYRCARDLAVEGFDPAWQEWRDYCPNATTLSALGAFGKDCDPTSWE
jgi:hypothetical protein